MFTLVWKCCTLMDMPTAPIFYIVGYLFNAFSVYAVIFETLPLVL